MRLNLAIVAAALVCAANPGTAATTSFQGSIVTRTKCTTSYGPKTVKPVPTSSTSTTSASSTPTTVISTVKVTPTPTKTKLVTETVTNTLFLNAITTTTITTTVTRTTSKPSTTVTVPTPAGFTPLAIAALAPRTTSLNKRATQTPKPTKTTSYPTAVTCTKLVVYVTASPTVVSKTTKTVPPSTITGTTTVTAKQTATAYRDTSTATRTFTKAVQPTAYAQCAGSDNLASKVRMGDGSVRTINTIDANDDIFWNYGIEGNSTARGCCERCAARDDCIGSAWVSDKDKYATWPYNYQCTLYLTLVDCPFDLYPLPYGNDANKPTPPGSYVLSNGACGGWTRA